MPNSKLIISISVFSFLLFCTSIIKNKTRVIEKKIINFEKTVSNLEKELFESQLDYHYLTSPKLLDEKISFLTSDQYQSMSFSKIYLDYNSFIEEQKKISKK